MSLIDRLLHGKEIDRLTEEQHIRRNRVEEEDPESEEELKEDIAEEPDASEEDSDVEYEVVEREILPAKIICPDCGGITLEGLEFCDKCGGELQ